MKFIRFLCVFSTLLLFYSQYSFTYDSLSYVSIREIPRLVAFGTSFVWQSLKKMTKKGLGFYTKAYDWESWWKTQEEKYAKEVETSEKAAVLLCSSLNEHKDMLFKHLGASTSHYQVEGGYDEVIDKNGNYADTVELYAQENELHQPLKSVDFWNNYKVIIPRLKKELNLNMLRISIGWSRVQPDEDRFDHTAIERYIDIVKTLKKYDIEPLVTFHHYTNPVWFQKLGGFEKIENLRYFVNYCVVMYDALSEFVQYFSTINGAEGYALRAYYAKETPPFEKNLQKAIQVQCNILKAHVDIYYAIKSLYAEKKQYNTVIREPLIGIQKTVHPIDISLKNIKHKLLLPLSTIYSIIGNIIQNQGFDRFFTTGIFSVNIPGVVSVYHVNYAAPYTLDWIGINCYANRLMAGKKSVQVADKEKRSESKRYYACPWIIYRAVKQVFDTIVKPINDRYEKFVPIIITENGLATQNEEQREKYYKNIVIALHLILEKGYPLIGYLPWTAVDCFEWRCGLTHNYGLVEVDFMQETHSKMDKRNTLPVIKGIKPGAKFYREVIKAVQRRAFEI